jgi:hypothetical protein
MTISPANERRALRAIAVATIASGAVQVVVPGRVLAALDAERDTTSEHLFATVGMFMVCVGGAMAADLQRADIVPARDLTWLGLQKLGAAAAVGIGVHRGVFARRALAVAGFDLCSGLLVMHYRKRRDV